VTVHVFSGPSTAGSQVRGLAGLCPHPPIAQGDLYRLRLGPGDIVLIIDGVCRDHPQVRHKEILALCAEGVRVYGAAGIGALRARELSDHGMTGLGTVFGWYRDGRLNSDADVAFVHGEADAGYRVSTHALVSVLDACDRLVSAGRLDAGAVPSAMDIARSVHFTERSAAALVAVARGSAHESAMRAIATLLADPGLEVKRRDAEAAIRGLLARPSDGSTRPVVAGVPDSSYAREWRLEFSPATAGAGAPTRRQLLAYVQLFRPDFPHLHTEYVLAHLDPEHPSVGVGCRSPRWLAGVGPRELVRRGLLAQRELTTLSPAQRDLRILVRSFRLRSGRLVYEELPGSVLADISCLTTECARMLALSEQAMRANPLFHPADVPAAMVREVFRDLWHAEDLPTQVLDRGFRDMDDFELRARPFYVAARAAVALNSPPRRSGQ
jgi:hypothetical protein